MAKQLELIISPNGTSRHLNDPDANRVFAAVGPAQSVRRNSRVDTWMDLTATARNLIRQVDDGRMALFCVHGSHVMSQLRADGAHVTATAYVVWDCLWWADMRLSGGPILGPYNTREDALQEEKTWLSRHELPAPR